jgi:quinohemoprotein ethanol dehydrogenase
MPIRFKSTVVRVARRIADVDADATNPCAGGTACRAIAASIAAGLAACMAGGSAKASEPQAADDGTNWTSYGRTADEDHFSPLSQIDDKTVRRLGLAWSFDLDPMISSFSAPLAVDGNLYFAVGYSVVHAVDAASGKLLWKYDPKVSDVSGEKSRAAHGIRGIAYWSGKVITGTQDGRLIAVDVKTGKLVWSVQTTEGPDDGRYITGAPRVFNGKVIIGHGGGDLSPVRGYVTAYDATTGKQLWRFYTVPGDPSKGFEDKAMEAAAKTWTGDWWKYGGGATVWNSITFDPEFNRIYLGTGNGNPWNQKIRSPGGGDNLFVCSIVALDADTGKYVWHYQTTPGDTWDFDASTDMQLTTLKIAGKDRQVLLSASKNGFFYVIDRKEGRLISAEPFTKVTWAKGVDAHSGRPIENPEARFPSGSGVMQPGGTGGHNWQAMAYSPETRLAYIPTTIMPFGYDASGIDPKTWRAVPHLQSNTGYNTLRIKDPPPIVAASLGSLQAWDPVQQKNVWTVPLMAPYNGGIAVTAGNLVFQGNAQGRFVAYAADTGSVLWSFDAQDGIVAQPISFSVNGRQYVTVITGFSGIAAALGPQVAQFGWDYRAQHRRVLTFALDGKATLPTVAAATQAKNADDPAFVVDGVLVDKGNVVYAEHCFMCHGLAAVAAGAAPDLRKSSIPLDAAAFESVVRGGALKSKGMPQFQELQDEDLSGLRNFIRYQARK